MSVREWHQTGPLPDRRRSASVCVLVCASRVGAVAKGMPWLLGASQPADGSSLEVAAPLSFIGGDRRRRCLPVLLTEADSRSAGTAGPCDG